MNRILIVDDHALFRGTLRQFLSQEPDFEIVGEASSMREAIRCVRSLGPHLVLTDLTMPDAHGVEAVTELKRHYPDIKILVMSLHCEYEYKYRCCKAGAAGYIVKDAVHEELCDGIRTVMLGRNYLGADAHYDTLATHALMSAANNEDRSLRLH